MEATMTLADGRGLLGWLMSCTCSVRATVVGGAAPAFATPPMKALRLIAARRLKGSRDALLTFGLEAA